VSPEISSISRRRFPYTPELELDVYKVAIDRGVERLEGLGGLHGGRRHLAELFFSSNSALYCVLGED
jgi:hypothetical protein